MTFGQRLRVPLLVALLVVVLDQLSKWWIVRMWPEPQSGEMTFIPHLVGLTYIRNEGVAFGLFQGIPQFFTITSLVIVAGLIYFYLHSLPAGDRLVSVLVGMIIGGAIGNVLDRVRLNYVVDFIKTFDGHFPIFNVADSCVSVGVIILAAYLFLLDRRKPVVPTLAQHDRHA
ncbi:MAG: signal peptidase II [Herpetosiphonaceae bacterium]|nr:signal peptidase II [Herpetosiphonaceae bacterium]